MNFAALIYCFIIFGTASSLTPDDGLQNLEEGRKLFHQGNYERASRHFWQAVLFHSEAKIRNNNHEVYSVQDAFRPFLECYARQGKILDAYLFIAEESIRRNEQAMAEVYIEQVLSMDSTNENALRLKEALLLLSPPSSSPDNSLEKAAEMYDLGTSLFDEKKTLRLQLTPLINHVQLQMEIWLLVVLASMLFIVVPILWNGATMPLNLKKICK